MCCCGFVLGRFAIQQLLRVQLCVTVKAFRARERGVNKESTRKDLKRQRCQREEMSKEGKVKGKRCPDKEGQEGEIARYFERNRVQEGEHLYFCNLRREFDIKNKRFPGALLDKFNVASELRLDLCGSFRKANYRRVMIAPFGLRWFSSAASE